MNIRQHLVCIKMQAALTEEEFENWVAAMIRQRPDEKDLADKLDSLRHELDATDVLWNGFVWKSSEQGHTYWNDVVCRLKYV